MSTPLGSKIRELREKKGWTLEQLATESGASKSYIWELENKTPPRPSAEKLTGIADALGVTLAYLLGDGTEVTEPESEDAHFFRNFQKMDPTSKAMLKAMVEKWTEKNDSGTKS
jgi:transcriptional regulator with XRE-family HTH domain